MRKPGRSLVFIQTLCLIGLLGFTGCSNGNLFGGLHNRGDSSDTETLLSEASNALREKDYGAARNLYERVLAQDPKNSDALYGAASAAIGSSGLNLGNILSNVVKQTNAAPSILGLADLIADSRESIRPAASNANSLLAGVDLEALNAVIDTAICRLSKIVAGAADGSIPPNDIDVLLNLGSLCVIRGVLKPLRENLMDIRNNNGTYEVYIDPTLTAGVCDGSQLVGSFTNAADQRAFIKRIALDLVATYALFNRAANLLNLSGDQIIARLRADVEEAAEKLLADGGTRIVPQECLDVIAEAGISVGSFKSYNDVFTTPPTGC